MRLLFTIALILSFSFAYGQATERELVTNFYRTTAEQISTANRKFAEEHRDLLFKSKRQFKDFAFLPDSIFNNGTIQIEDGFKVLGIVYSNEIRSLGKVVIVGEFVFQAKENRSRLIMTPRYYIAEGGKSDCPLTGDIEIFRECKNTNLTYANFVENFRTSSYELKKKYKSIMEDYLRADPDRW